MPDIRSNVNRIASNTVPKLVDCSILPSSGQAPKHRTTLTTQRTQSTNYHDTRTSTRKHRLETTHNQLTSSRSPTYRQKRPSHQHPCNCTIISAQQFEPIDVVQDINDTRTRESKPAIEGTPYKTKTRTVRRLLIFGHPKS